MYLIVRDADTVVVGVYASDPGAAPASHTKYNETPNISIRGWNGANVITRTGVNTYVSTAFIFQKKSFAVDDSDDSKVIITRAYGNRFDFSTAFTIIIPYKANWVTGPATNYIMDLKTAFYMLVSQSGGRLGTRHFDATSNESINITLGTALTDGEWLWTGITYDGAGGYQTIFQDSFLANSGTKVLVDSTDTFRFGERFGYTVTQDMSMGNVLIVNKVISGTELTNYYNGGVSIDARDVFDDTEIVHYYCADNFVDQTTVPDSGGVTTLCRGALCEKGLLTTTNVPS